MRTMKDSGIPWIGKIPENWKVSKLKYFVDCYDGKRVPVDASLRNSGPYPYWGAGSIMDYVDDYLFDEELVLLGEDGAPFFDYTRPVAFYVNEKVWVNNHIHVLMPHASIDIKYLIHYLNNVDYKSYINGSILNKLTQTNMNSIAFVFPDKEEQKRIANYLDAECARIDAVMEQTRASIEEYKKLKQSVITQAVTKGIRPNRPMKDSGIDWIGQIPEDWDIQRIKNVANIFGRIGFRGYTTDDLVSAGEGAITLSPSNIQDLSMSYEKCTYISWDKYNESPEIQIDNGDIIFVKTGSSYGKSGLVTNLPLQATINPQLVVFKDIRLNHLFFLYFLQTPSIRNEIESIVSGGTIPTMGQEKMRNFHVCVPSIDEQAEIADSVSNELGRINQSIKKKEQLLSEMESYKKSLIFEYVTGKKEVCTL